MNNRVRSRYIHGLFRQNFNGIGDQDKLSCTILCGCIHTTTSPAPLPHTCTLVLDYSQSSSWSRIFFTSGHFNQISTTNSSFTLSGRDCGTDMNSDCKPKATIYYAEHVHIAQIQDSDAYSLLLYRTGILNPCRYRSLSSAM